MELVYLDPYHFFNRTIMPDKPVIVKVGVCGTADLEMAGRLYPEARIIGYEADPLNYRKQNDACMTVFYGNAVGEQKTVKLYRFANSVSHSIYPRHTYDANCKLLNTIEVASISIDMVMKNIESAIDLLILNCEGGELPILQSLHNKETRDRIAQICVSFHDPRIYPTADRHRITDPVAQYYYAIKGDCPKGGIPDTLLILRR